MSFLFCSIEYLDEELDERPSALLSEAYAMLTQQLEDMRPLPSVLQQYV